MDSDVIQILLPSSVYPILYAERVHLIPQPQPIVMEKHNIHSNTLQLSQPGASSVVGTYVIWVLREAFVDKDMRLEQVIIHGTLVFFKVSPPAWWSLRKR